MLPVAFVVVVVFFFFFFIKARAQCLVLYSGDCVPLAENDGFLFFFLTLGIGCPQLAFYNNFKPQSSTGIFFKMFCADTPPVVVFGIGKQGSRPRRHPMRNGTSIWRKKKIICIAKRLLLIISLCGELANGGPCSYRHPCLLWRCRAQKRCEKGVRVFPVPFSIYFNVRLSSILRVLPRVSPSNSM